MEKINHANANTTAKVDTTSYIKADDNIIINERHIRWLRKVDDCINICYRHSGCVNGYGTVPICKINSPESYDKLLKHFL